MMVRRSSRLLNGCLGQFLGLVIVLAVAGGITALVEHLNAPKAPPPLAIGHAPAKPTGHVEVAGTPDEYGFDPAGDWPNACDLLTDQDIRAIFPQVTGDITRTGIKADINVWDVSGQTAGEQLEVPNAGCDLEFLLPSTDGVDKSKVNVSINGVGDPNTLRQNVEHDKEEAAQNKELDAPPPVADGCVYRAGYSDYICGSIEVSTSVDDLGISDTSQEGRSIDRIQVGTKVTSFTSSQADQEKKFEDTYVNPELIKAVLAKLPAS